MFNAVKQGRRLRAGLGIAALAAGMTAGLGGALPALGQETIGELAAYTGADRMDKLIAGAKKEGALMVYTSFTVADMTAVTDAFTAAYGIPVEIWRGSSEDVLQRGLTEAQAGRYTVDVFENSGRELEALAREGMVVPVESPIYAEILPDAVPDHHMWVGSRLNLIVACYNTGLVDGADLPKTWADLLDPKWKGKLGIEYEDYDWFATIVSEFPSEEEGLEFFRKLVSTNGISVRKGHTLLTNLTASGEVPLALTVFDFTAKQVKADGAPFDWFTIGAIPARLNGVAVAKNAPHPNAALLFHEFMIGDGQKVLAERNVTPTNITRVPLPEGVELKLVDPAWVLDEGERWAKLYEDIVTAPK